MPDAGWGMRQEGRPLGERLHAAWEWDGVLEQVAEFGWTALDVRWGQATHAHAHAHMRAKSQAPSARGTCHPPTQPPSHQTRLLGRAVRSGPASQGPASVCCYTPEGLEAPPAGCPHRMSCCPIVPARLP